MIAKRCLLVLVVMGLTFLFTSAARPASVYEKKTLEGLEGVYVSVEGLTNEIKGKLPFNENNIRVDVELKLRMAGIKVFSIEEGPKTPGVPCLEIYLSIDDNKVSDVRFFYYHVNLGLRQWFFLARDTNIISVGTTWSHTGLGCVIQDKVSMIRDRIKDEVDRFINDYLSVNPKGGK